LIWFNRFTLFYCKISVLLIIRLVLIEFLKSDLVKNFKIVNNMVKADRLIFFISIKPWSIFGRKVFKKCILGDDWFFIIIFIRLGSFKHFHNCKINKIRVSGFNSSFKCILKSSNHFCFFRRVTSHPKIKRDFFRFRFFFF
jgi:hypothetical protein